MPLSAGHSPRGAWSGTASATPSAYRGGAPLSVHIDSALVGTRQEYGLRQLLIAAGIPFRLSSDNEPAVYYGVDQHIGSRSALWIESHGSDQLASSQWSVIQKMPVPMGLHRDEGTRDARKIPLDLGAICAFWINLCSEQRAPQRDEHGRVPSSQSLLGRLGLLHDPPLHAYADFLRRCMERVGLSVSTIDRWPDGKRWAVVMTHDVDEPETPNAAHPCIQRIILGPHRRRREAYWALRAELRSRGLSEGLIAGAEGRREWDFDHYCEVEVAAQMRSMFYFSVVPKPRGHARDVTYDLSRSRFRRLMTRLKNGGWEIGLHAAYETIEDRPALAWQARRLISLMHDVPVGMRHHYLRLDPRRPLHTLQAAAECQLLCDSSIGFNDAPGFRAGTAMPFVIYGEAGSLRNRFVELPMTLSDMHLPKDDVRVAVQIALAHLSTARQLGGMAVLNWHVGNWHARPAWRESFRAICRSLAEDSTVWVPNVTEAASWVNFRANQLFR